MTTTQPLRQLYGPADPPLGAATRRRPGLGAALRWEVRKLRAQRRAKTVLLAALLGPIPIAVISHGQARPPKDTLFGRFATENGFALSLLVLAFVTQWVLPLLT